RPLLEEAGAPKPGWNTHRVALDPAAIVRDAAFQSTLIDMLAFALQEDEEHADAAHAKLREHVSARLARLFAAPLAHPKEAKRFLAHLEPAQDALGMHMDVTVALERFRADAQADPQALYAVGY